MLTFFGGSFDPPHNGHVNGILNIAKQLNLTAIRFMPCAISPLKTNTRATAEQRLSMLNLLCRSLKKTHSVDFSVDDREFALPQPSYTIQTLQHIRQEFGNNVPLLFVVGQDSIDNLERWKQWQDITQFCHLIVMPRQPKHSHYSEQLEKWLSKKSTLDVAMLKNHPFGKLFFSQTPLTTISSSEIRDMIKHNPKNADTWLQADVASYIKKHKIYT